MIGRPCDPRDASEEGLCALALAGDVPAWDALIARHRRRVEVALLGRGVSLDQARDLAQEAWLRVIEQQRRGALNRLELPGLVITQAGFLLRDAARRRRPVVDAEALRDHASSEGEPEATMLQREQVRRVTAALGRCPERARRVFERVYEAPDVSYAAVAQEHGLSLQRVKQIVWEVRARLRAALEGDDR